MKETAKFFELAFDRAFAQIGITSPNPAVGAVVVRDGTVAGSGGTQVCGGAHAEVCAISAAGDACRGADLYVTLEPCCHHGKTPPCTDAIIRAGIRRVFVAVRDPNPLVSGKGIDTLRAAGVEVVECPEYAEASADLLRPFFSRLHKARPHCLYKAAFSADGCTASHSGDSKWISSIQSRYAVHRLRACVDAVIVGKGTVEADNPALTCRLGDFPAEAASYFSDLPVRFSGSGNAFISRLFAPAFENAQRSPVRVCVGLPVRADALKFFDGEDWFLFEKKARLDALRSEPGYESLPGLEAKGRVVAVPDEADTPGFVLKALGEKGMNFVMLEGGGRLASSFERSGCIDEYLFFIAPKVFGGGRPVMNGEGCASASDARAIASVSAAFCGPDLVYHGYSL